MPVVRSGGRQKKMATRVAFTAWLFCLARPLLHGMTQAQLSFQLQAMDV